MTCSICRFSKAGGGKLLCRRHPPVGHPIVAMTNKGPQLMGTATIWPEVQHDGWCGEFSGIIPVASLDGYKPPLPSVPFKKMG